MHRKEIRGFKILKSSRARNYSIKLFTQRDRSFYVMFTRYFLGFPLKTKIYEFSDREQAEMCYTRQLGERLRISRELF